MIILIAGNSRVNFICFSYERVISSSYFVHCRFSRRSSMCRNSEWSSRSEPCSEWRVIKQKSGWLKTQRWPFSCNSSEPWFGREWEHQFLRSWTNHQSWQSTGDHRPNQNNTATPTFDRVNDTQGRSWRLCSTEKQRRRIRLEVVAGMSHVQEFVDNSVFTTSVRAIIPIHQFRNLFRKYSRTT